MWLMFRGELFKELFDKYSKERPILLIGDPDVDGLLSLYLMTEFCNKFNLKYEYYVNSRRKHGFFLNPKDYGGYLIISADFTISESKVKEIVDSNIILLSTDHHSCQGEFICYKGVGVVWNNQYPFEPEEDRYLSGAGVFYELVCSQYPEFKCAEYEALVGVTLLSDVRAIENDKAKRYLRKTYHIDTSEGYINHLISSTMSNNSYNFGKQRLDRNFIDYTLSPVINSLLRFDHTSVAVDFILGGYLPPEELELRDKQKKLLDLMEEKVLMMELPNVTVVALNEKDFDNIDISSFIGYYCNRVMDRDGRVNCLGFVMKDGIVTRASFRGRYGDINYLKAFREIGISADGHSGAFGLIDFSPVDDLFLTTNSTIEEIEKEHKTTIKVYSTTNLNLTVLQKGSDMAEENCYVRDLFRSYIRYTGSNAKILSKYFKKEELTQEDILKGVEADEVVKGVRYKYIRDKLGNPIPYYILYLVDGLKVKSFGVSIEEGLILPIKENGYINLYLRDNIN